MEKIVKVVDEQRGIVQITTADERWYAMSMTDPATKLPAYQYVPSVTWIAGFYPKGVQFYKWLAQTGWDESQAIKEAAGEKGSMVHQAINLLLDGIKIGMDQPIQDPQTKELRPLTLEEYQALMSFVDWHRQNKPITIAKDIVVWSRQNDYAGTSDYVCIIGGVLWLIDFKTSKSVWPSHRIQVSAYRHTPEIEALMTAHGFTEIKMGILQLGYKRNADGFKLTEVPEKPKDPKLPAQFDLFLAARQIWVEETAGQEPLQRDYPIHLSLETVDQLSLQPVKPKKQEAPAPAVRKVNGNGSRKVAVKS